MSGNIIDNDLILRASEGDNRAMAEIIAEMLPSVEMIAGKYAGSGVITHRDLIQEGLLGLLNAVNSFSQDKGASFKTYALTCIKNKISDAVKAQSRNKNMLLNDYVSLDGVDEDNSGDPQRLVSSKEGVDEIYRCINEELSETERQVLSMYLDGKRCDEIAQELSISKKSAENALSRARKKIKANTH